MSPIRARRRRPLVAVTVLVVLAVLLNGCALLKESTSGYTVQAEFARGTGLYPGSPVRVLGINVGRITAVRNVGDHVQVTLKIDDGTKIPADATATIVPLTLLGERYVQMAPAYTGGPTLKGGARIPISRTAVPVEIDELLRGLKDLVGSIDPKKASDVVTKMARLLDGQGADLNELLGNARGTLDLLADKGDDLRDIIRSLGELSATLRGRTQSIETLIRNYNLVAGVLIQNRGDLDASITELDRAAVELTSLLKAHEDPLREDVVEVTKVGRTLDRNFDHLDITLASTVKLFEAAGRAYDPERNALTINDQLNPGFTSELLAGRLRDRVAGLCRRLGIDFCSDPSSELLQSLAGLIPGLINGLGSNPLQSEPVSGDQQPAPTPTTTAPPAPTTAAPVLPTAPDPGALVDQLTQLLATGLDDAHRAALGALDPALLQALLTLDPAQLAVLPKLGQQQIDELKASDPADLSDTLNRLAAEVQDPGTLLEPILPPAPTKPKGSGGAPASPLSTFLGTLLGGGS